MYIKFSLSVRKLRHHRDRVEVLKLDEEKLSAMVESEKEDIDTLERVLEMIEKLETMHEEQALDLDTAMQMFEK